MTETKITLATLKKFIREHNPAILEIKVLRDHYNNAGGEYQPDWQPVQSDDCPDLQKNTLGIKGLWLVGHSRDYFSLFTEPERTGIMCSNCCGSWILAWRR